MNLPKDLQPYLVALATRFDLTAEEIVEPGESVGYKNWTDMDITETLTPGKGQLSFKVSGPEINDKYANTHKAFHNAYIYFLTSQGL